MSPIQKKDPVPTSVGDMEESPTVINLSSVAIDHHEISLLSMGLSFCPTLRQANHEEILDDLESYFMCLCLKECYLDEDEDTSDSAETHTLFCPPSQWMPPKGRKAVLETCIKKARTDMERQLQINKNKRCIDNLPSVKKYVLRNLQ